MQNKKWLCFAGGGAFLAWCSVVLALFFFSAMKKAEWRPVWDETSLYAAAGLGVGLCVFNLATFLAARTFRIPPGRILGGGLLGLSLIVLMLSADHLLWLKFMAFIGLSMLMGLGLVFLCRALAGVTISFWLGFLAAAMVFQFWLFALGMMQVLTPRLMLLGALVVACGGLYELAFRKSGYAKTLLAGLDRLDAPSILYAQGLWVALVAAFIAAYSPETYHDATRSHVPYMLNAIRNEGLAPNYYFYAHLAPLPVSLLATSGYMAFGEFGSKWVTWLVGIGGIMVVVEEVFDSTRDLAAALATGLLLATVPYIWVWLTTNYYDWPMAAFSLAAVAGFRRALTREPGYLPLAGAFLGFAVAVKLNAGIFAVALVVMMILLYCQVLQNIFRQRPGLFLKTVGLAIAVAAPWFIAVWSWTGNPLFPFANNFFGGGYFSPDLLEQVLDHHRKLFKFPLGWLDLLLWPWSLTFSTKYFGEAPAGAVGPLLLILYPGGLFYLVHAASREKRLLSDQARFSWMVFATAACYLAAVSFLMSNTPYLRYWLLGLALIAIVYGHFMAKATVLVRETFGQVWLTAGAGVFVYVALTILLAWGARINYDARDGIGWDYYLGRISRDEYLFAKTGNAYRYVNRHIRPGESVLAVGYLYLSTFDNFSLFLAPWLDANFGLGDKANYDQLVSNLVANLNVRYWVIRDADDGSRSRLGFYTRHGLREKYWRDELRVYSSGGYSVYTTKPEAEPRPFSVETLTGEVNGPAHERGWNINGFEVDRDRGVAKGRFDTQIFRDFAVPPETSRIGVAVNLDASVEGSTIVADTVWYRGHTEVSRSANTITAKTGANTMRFEAFRPTDADRLLIILRPWRAEDGVITLRGARLSWWK